MNSIVFILGLLIGSFLNVCIFRIPIGKSIVFPPSTCSSCGHKLNYIDMIPVVNYIINKGRCRYCKEKYSLQYPLIELFNATLYLIIYNFYGYSLNTLFYCIICSMLIVIAMIDYKNMIIPNGILIFGLIVAIFFNILSRADLIDLIIGCAISFIFFLLIAVLTNAMGGGDVKLIALLGFCFGIKGIIFIIIFSFIIGALTSVILLALKIKSRKDMICFGPFISLASLLYILFGKCLIQLYLGICGFI